MIQQFTGEVEVPRCFIGVPPMPPYALIGRDDALRELRERLTSGTGTATAALHGMPGVGKTTLATALAHDAAVRRHFRGGVLWAALGPQSDVEAALDLWAAAMGIRLSCRWGWHQKAQRLAALLVARPVLLVLDDVWHWWAAEPLVNEFGFAGCVRLCTTRDASIARRFANGPETPVAELSREDAEKLLAARCPTAMATDPEGVRALAKAVGGLPLGLSLIAGTLIENAGQARWSRNEIERLMVTPGWLGLTGPERPGTLQAIVDMSVTALDADAQDAFTNLSVFAAKPASFGREAALAVWGVDEKKGDGWLKILVDRGLLETAGEDRFAMHKVLADVATRRAGGWIQVAYRHARYYEELAHSAHDNRQIVKDLEQIHRAWEWIRTDEVKSSLPIDPRLTGAEEDKEPPRQARGDINFDGFVSAYALGSRRFAAGNYFGAREDYKQALSISRDLGRRMGEACALDLLAQSHVACGDNEQALDCYAQLVLVLRDRGTRDDEAKTLNRLGGIWTELRDLKRALQHYEQALPIWRDLRDRTGEAQTLHNIGSTYRSLGEPKRALEYYEQALPIWREVHNRAAEARTLDRIGRTLAYLGYQEHALHYYEQALPHRRNAGDRAGEAATLFAAASARDNNGETLKAISLATQALEIAEDVRTVDSAWGRVYLEGLRARQRTLAADPSSPAPPLATPLVTDDPPERPTPPVLASPALKWNAKLSGEEIEELTSALVSAFPSRPALARMLRVRLDKNLDEIAAAGNLRDTAFELVTHAEAQGFVHDLFSAAIAEAPKNAALLAIASKRGT